MSDGILVGDSGINVGNGGVLVDASGTSCCCGGERWRQSRICVDGSLDNVYFTETDADVLLGVFGPPCPFFELPFPDNGWKYYIDPDDAVLTSLPPGAIVYDLTGILCYDNCDDATNVTDCGPDCPASPPSFLEVGLPAFIDFGTVVDIPTCTPSDTSSIVSQFSSGGDNCRFQQNGDVCIAGYITDHSVSGSHSILVFSDVDGFSNPIWVVTFYFKSPDRGFVSISFYRPRKCFNIYGQYTGGWETASLRWVTTLAFAFQSSNRSDRDD
jgi:hypothetical protein